MYLLGFFSKYYYSDISGVELFYKKNVCKKDVTLTIRYKVMKHSELFQEG